MIEIGDYKFRTQKDAQKFIRSLLLSSVGDVENIDSSHQLFGFLRNLLERHPEHYAVIPDRFIIQRSFFGNLELAFASDGEKSVFRYNTCLRQAKYNSELNRALRGAVMKQTRAVVPDPGDLCELCGEEITAGQKFHVDHTVPFVKLKAGFLDSWQRPVPQEFNEDKTRGGFIEFKPEDGDFRRGWIDYHRRYAFLRPVHEMCNLKRPKGE